MWQVTIHAKNPWINPDKFLFSSSFCLENKDNIDKFIEAFNLLNTANFQLSSFEIKPMFHKSISVEKAIKFIKKIYGL